MATYRIGRDYTIPFAIDDKHISVSHDHATVAVEGDNWVLCDNDSTNGTYVEDNGVFRRCQKVSVTPSTWIRLGEQGHRGYYFKARRVLRPNDYREDFEELFGIYQEYEATRSKWESSKRIVKFVTPFLMFLGLGLSYIPAVSQQPWAVRGAFMLSGFLSPFIQDALMSRLEKKMKHLQSQLICPKCRRALGKDDILNREHTYCNAH